MLAALLAGLALVPPASAAGRSQDITWHGNQIKLYAAQATGRYGTGVVVAVLDGYVDGSHPDFEGRVRQGADCTSGTCVAAQAKDGCTHGTHVAGTVASSSFGVARKATVLPVRVLTDDNKGGCTGRPKDVAAGIRWAVAHGARVLNLSLGPDVPGIGSSSDIPTAVTEAANAGVVVVFSAGNADLPVAQSYGNDALVVAATGPNGQLADYSQHGAGVSVAAPGGQPDSSDVCTQSSCVTSLYPGGKYAVAAGTSMAAPHVSGIAALLFGQQPGRSRQNVMDRITGTAHPLSGAGSGLVDAKAALGVTSTQPAPTPHKTAAPPPVKVIPHAKPPSSAPVVKPSPTVSATTPVEVSPSPVSTVEPSTTPTSSVAEAPRSVRTASDDLPVAPVLIAAGLIAFAGAGVGATSLRSRP